MIRLVIFDFDDTIIDNKNLDYQSFKQISSELGGYIPTRQEIFDLRKKNFLAIDIIHWLVKKSKNRYSIKHFWRKRINFLGSINSLEYLSLRPYVKYLLQKLQKNQVIVVIATLRKNKNFLEIFLKKEGISHHIDLIYNLKDNKIETRKSSNAIKIKQNMIKLIQKSYGLKSNEILSIGDSLADYEAAKRCKINHVILKTDKKFKKISTKNISTSKELNSRIESIIKQ